VVHLQCSMATGEFKLQVDPTTFCCTINELLKHGVDS
jgi:hypothetical protein